MYRGIVFGDFGGIQEGVWVQLWSGVIGAILSAGIALFVLTRSNKNQRKAVEEQIDHQRQLAGREREMAAMADLLGVASRFTYLPYDADRPEVMKQIADFRAAVYRWALETQEIVFLGELERAAQVLSVASLNAVDAPHESSSRLLCVSAVQRMVMSLTEFGLAWYAVEGNDRAYAGGRLKASIDEREATLESLTRLGVMEPPDL